MMNRSTQTRAEQVSMLPQLQLDASPGFVGWLTRQQLSLAFTTYQSNRLFLIGRKADSDRLAVQERLFDRPMGLYWRPEGLTLSTRYQLWQLSSALEGQATHEGADRLYVPHQARTTGDVNTHELAYEASGRLVFVNTDFSCLATLHPNYSFEPVWQPRFISKLVPEDRCHLNGLALRDGVAAYVTACSTTDTVAGWREHRQSGGVVIDVPSNEVICTGLSMPHSPRWHQGRLWLLNAGTGELGAVDEQGHFEPLCQLPGFARGLAMVGDYAVVGLSKLRSSSLGGLLVEQRLAVNGQPAQCGLVIVQLSTGQVLEHLMFQTLVEELFDVVALPGVRQPRALGLQSDEIERLVTFPGSGGVVVAKPAAQGAHEGALSRVAGLPQADPATRTRAAAHEGEAVHAGTAAHKMLQGPIRFQQVRNLTAENLLPYDAFTWPRLSERWAKQAPRGELLGLSASVEGQMIGFAIAETSAGARPDEPARSELISWYLVPACRGRGIGKALLAKLQAVLPTLLLHPQDEGSQSQALPEPQP